MEFSDNFREDLKYLGITLAIAIAIIGFNNVMTPNEYPDVGFTQIETECAGLDVGVCLGIQHQEHEVLNFDEWEPIEEGTEEHRRMVESELMIRATEACRSENITDTEWTSEVEYENKTGDEWADEIEEVTLLPCSQTFHYSIDD